MNNPLAQKAQFYLNESHRLSEELQNEVEYVSLLESLIFEALFGKKALAAMAKGAVENNDTPSQLNVLTRAKEDHGDVFATQLSKIRGMLGIDGKVGNTTDTSEIGTRTPATITKTGKIRNKSIERLKGSIKKNLNVEELGKYVSSIIENDIFAALDKKNATPTHNEKATSNKNKQKNNTNTVYGDKNTIKSNESSNKKLPNPALARNTKITRMNRYY